MIFNKTISLILSACLFVLLLLITASAIMMFLPGGHLPFVGVILIVAFYFASRAFYRYLRNDGYYRNTRKHSSDRKGEKYLTKGESDTKKKFIVVWILVILLLAAISMVLYLVNKGIV
ncbi:hypothetical protein [Methanobrevibacter sp.]|uniref:hypothetical protein n=1 Tax=Methanobrevibacter sp. TaxID=66852 RepID=UPI0025E420DD|nr:hypothetical protein [Methanobrevibacter sp.]MBQ2831578.1 hypothetical protein [Methanobrevibacter sp.]